MTDLRPAGHRVPAARLQPLPRRRRRRVGRRRLRRAGRAASRPSSSRSSSLDRRARRRQALRRRPDRARQVRGRGGGATARRAREARAARAPRLRRASCWRRTASAVDFDDPANATRAGNLRRRTPTALLDVAFAHPIRLIANALGVPPQVMIDRARRAGRAGRCTGRREGARDRARCRPASTSWSRQGCEAGGHCGEVSTLVLVPEVLRGDPPDPHRAGARRRRHRHGPPDGGLMALGAAGAWTGSVWLTTAEAETIPR